MNNFKANIIRRLARSPFKSILKPFATEINDLGTLSQLSTESFQTPSKYLQSLLQIQHAARRSGKSIVDLSFGAPIFSDSWNQNILKLIRNTPYQDQHLSYPSAGGYWSLRSNLLRIFQESWEKPQESFTPEQILVTNGANQLISLIIDAFSSPNDGVILFDPSYMLYAFKARMKSLNLKYISSRIDSNGFLQFSKDDFENASRRSKIAFINSPCNPTGAVLKIEDFHFIRKICKEKEVILVRDEVYDEFHSDTQNYFSKFPPYSNEIILKSFSKSFGFAGLRLGYALAKDEYIKILRLHQACTVPFVSAISQCIAEQLLNELDTNDAKKERLNILTYVQEAFHLLRAHGIESPKKANGMYIWYPIDKLSTEQFCIKIAEKFGIILMPGDSFGKSARKFVRISVRNEHSLEAIEQILKFSKSSL